jgi:hypothetical protein
LEFSFNGRRCISKEGSRAGNTQGLLAQELQLR